MRFVSLYVQSEKLRAEAGTLPGIRAELEALRRRHSAALELMGERDEEVISNLFLCGNLNSIDVWQRHAFSTPFNVRWIEIIILLKEVIGNSS